MTAFISILASTLQASCRPAPICHRQQTPGLIHHHHAGGSQLLPDPGENLSPRKLYEVLLAFKIEQNLTKDQILEVYINQIFLGRRPTVSRWPHTPISRQVHPGSEHPEAAMLAGLPKAPSAYNPVVNPKRAAQRQQYVLRRMAELGFISEAEHAPGRRDAAEGGDDSSDLGGSADYIAEMARQIAYEQYREEAYTKGTSRSSPHRQG